MVLGRAKAAGTLGENWLSGLDVLVDALSAAWKIRIGNVLQGGSHALVCDAVTENGTACILKIELPDTTEEEYLYGIRVLELANGNGYPKLYAFDLSRRACLLEKLGQPMRSLPLTAEMQMKRICAALPKTWSIRTDGEKLRSGAESLDWFESFIPQAWAQLGRPCSAYVIRYALQMLAQRKEKQNPAEYVLVHGDAHNNNMLQVPGMSDEFKLIDPDGLIFEKAYDLGVLMREWPEEYRTDASAAGRRRAAFLHSLTGVEEKAIREWGFLQMTATALLLLQIGDRSLGMEMLRIAESWCEGV